MYTVRDGATHDLDPTVHPPSRHIPQVRDLAQPSLITRAGLYLGVYLLYLLCMCRVCVLCLRVAGLPVVIADGAEDDPVGAQPLQSGPAKSRAEPPYPK